MQRIHVQFYIIEILATTYKILFQYIKKGRTSDMAKIIQMIQSGGMNSNFNENITDYLKFCLDS